MNKKLRGLLLTATVCLLLALGGCAVPSRIEKPPVEDEEPVKEGSVKEPMEEVVEQEEEKVEEVVEQVEVPNTPENVILPEDNPPPDNMTWISPGKVVISNFFPGARAEYYLSVHNGDDEECPFVISCRAPDRLYEGASFPPEEFQDWIIIADTDPVIAPESTEDVFIVLEMPEDAESPESWEFWVSVQDASQAGLVQTELCSRWLVNMR